jgi:hypothetical protein
MWHLASSCTTIRRPSARSSPDPADPSVTNQLRTAAPVRHLRLAFGVWVDAVPEPAGTFSGFARTVGRQLKPVQ